jgi:hypothetical protein
MSQRKLFHLETALFLPPVFDGYKYEVLSVRLKTVLLNGVCTINLIKSLLGTVHKLSEDVAHLKSDSALFMSQIDKLHETVGHRPWKLGDQPQGSLPFRVGLEQSFSTFVRPRPTKFFFYKTRAQYQAVVQRLRNIGLEANLENADR